ncbi:MAG: DUF3048 domain-containing protein [Clostridia bacterium]|nr:DUF3048 domain-containing protein [Clostridia bacterium]
MKKASSVIALFLTAVLILSACQTKKTSENGKITKDPVKKETVTEQKVPKAEEKEKDPEIEAFFDKYVNSKKRPIAVMIDNDNEQARPQAGLDDAYLIYEMVIEGGATRFMAFFKDAATEKIGPVRSSRHYFLDYALENDAIYTHFGWSPRAMTDIPALGVNNINGIIAGDDSIFWRERKFKGDWHSAFTSIEKINSMADKKKYQKETAHANSINYSKEYLDMKTESVANTVSLAYSYHYTTGYTYDTETKLYEKTINGKPHTMQNGKTVKVKNIIVQFITDTSLGDGSARRNINTAGSGKGYYITDGCCKSITWSKDSRTANTIYKDADGNTLSVNPGKTIINIISPSAKITMK